MKKWLLISFISVFVFGLSACKQLKPQEEQPSKVVQVEKVLSIEKEETQNTKIKETDDF